MADQSAEVSALIGSLVRGIFIGCRDPATGRRLCHQLLRDAWQLEAAKTAGRGDSQFDARDALDGLEMVLVNIKGHMGANGAVRIEDAKRWLRDKGEPGRAVASMVGKVSKLRNTQAHPLAHRILEAIQALVAADHPKEALCHAPTKPPSAEDDDEASTASGGQAQEGKLADECVFEEFYNVKTAHAQAQTTLSFDQHDLAAIVIGKVDGAGYEVYGTPSSSEPDYLEADAAAGGVHGHGQVEVGGFTIVGTHCVEAFLEGIEHTLSGAVELRG